MVIDQDSNNSSINFNIVDEVPIWPGCYGLQPEMRGCFQRNVQANAKSLGIFPRDDLWVLYILLLAEFDYISELSKIIKWWIDLHFKPKKSTILCLLAALPEEFALRHIRHHQVAKLKKDWDWPTTREFKRYMWFQDQPKV